MRGQGRAAAAAGEKAYAFSTPYEKTSPSKPLLVRGTRHGATPAVRDGIAPRRWTDGGLGLAGQAVVLRQAAPILQAARRVPQDRVVLAQAHGQAPPTSSRLSDACDAAASSGAHPWRVVLTAEVRRAGDHPRLVVTALAAPTPQRLDEDLYGARGHGANALKAVQVARRRARTAATPCLAKAMRRWRAWAASALHHAWRTQTLQPTGLAHAQPSTMLRTLCKIAAQVNQDKEHILLPLPRSCPVKALLQRVTPWCWVVPEPAGHTSSGEQPLVPDPVASPPVSAHQ